MCISLSRSSNIIRKILRFYAGSTLLAVDRQMIDQGWVYLSRDPYGILRYLRSVKARPADLDRCRRVKKEVLNYLDRIIVDGR
jgi:predicted glycosyltransferase